MPQHNNCQSFPSQEQKHIYSNSSLSCGSFCEKLTATNCSSALVLYSTLHRSASNAPGGVTQRSAATCARRARHRARAGRKSIELIAAAADRTYVCVCVCVWVSCE